MSRLERTSTARALISPDHYSFTAVEWDSISAGDVHLRDIESDETRLVPLLEVGPTPRLAFPGPNPGPGPSNPAPMGWAVCVVDPGGDRFPRG
jgi:hypothetical protein